MSEFKDNEILDFLYQRIRKVANETQMIRYHVEKKRKEFIENI